MLNEMYRLLAERFHGKGIWAMLDYIAVKEGIADETSTPWLPIDLRERLDELWENNPYKTTREDHLGSLLVFQRIRVSGREYAPIQPQTAAEFVAKMTIDPDAVYQIEPFGTGRIALELTRAGANAIIGIEESLLLYRIALINIHLLDIPALLYYRSTTRQPNVWNPLVRKKKEQNGG